MSPIQPVPPTSGAFQLPQLYFKEIRLLASTSALTHVAYIHTSLKDSLKGILLAHVRAVLLLFQGVAVFVVP